MPTSKITNEMLQSVLSELNLFHFAVKNAPDLPIGRIYDCGCVGPMPECRCMKRNRLVKEFKEAMKDVDK